MPTTTATTATTTKNCCKFMAYIFNKFFASLRPHTQTCTRTHTSARDEIGIICAHPSLTHTEWIKYALDFSCGAAEHMSRVGAQISSFNDETRMLLSCCSVALFNKHEGKAKCLLVCLFKSVALENYVASEWKSCMQTRQEICAHKTFHLNLLFVTGT